MPKRKSISPLPFGDFEDDFEDETCSNGSNKHNLPVQRNAANARERARMRVLSSAFCRLKTKLPWVPSDTKLSKLDTLRLATIYIQQLRTSLTTTSLSGSDETGAQSAATAAGDTQQMHVDVTTTKTSSMVWPFSFPPSIDGNRNSTNGTINSGLTHWLSATRLSSAINGTTTDRHSSSAASVVGVLASDHQHQHQHHMQSINCDSPRSANRMGYLGNTTTAT